MQRMKALYFCPYLHRYSRGVICGISLFPIKDIQYITLDICKSRRFEFCYIYLSKLEEMSGVVIPATSLKTDERSKYLFDG